MPENKKSTTRAHSASTGLAPPQTSAELSQSELGSVGALQSRDVNSTMTSSDLLSPDTDHMTTQRTNVKQPGQDRTGPSGPLDLAITVGLTLVSAIAYWRTLTHGLLVDDSAEFQTMARLFGHTHPTGYEVYTFVAGLAALVPIGNPATRVTAWSAVAGALTVGVVYLTIRQLGARTIGAIVGALSLAVGATFWSQSVIAEVYTTGLLLAAIILGAIVRWDTTQDRKWLFAAGAAGGLSLGVHFTNGLFLPAIALFLVLSNRQWSTWKVAIAGAAAGTALAIVAFGIIDLVNPPNQYFDAVVAPSASAWDLEAGDVDGVGERIRFDWTARQFQSQMFSDPGRLMPERWADFRGTLSNELSLVGLGLVGLGSLGLLRRSPTIAALIFLSLLVQLVYAFNYEIGDLVYVFYLPAYLLLALLLGVGLDLVGRGMARIPLPVKGSGQLGTAAVGLLALLPVVQPNLGSLSSATTPLFEFESYPVESDTELIVAATIQDLPQNSVVLTDWDLLYTYVYVASVEQGRDDLIFHETQPADDSDVLAESMLSYIASIAENRPVFVSDYTDQFRAAGFYLSPIRVGPTRMFRVRLE